VPAPSRRLAALAIGLVLVLVPLIGWALDAISSDGAALRNVEVADAVVGGDTRQEVASVVDGIAVRYADTPVALIVDNEMIDTSAGELGLAVDPAATVDAVMDEGRSGFIVGRITSWLGSLVSPRTVQPVLAVDDTIVERTIATLDADPSRLPREPGFELINGELTAVDGRSGRRLDPDDVESALRTATFEDESITITLSRREYIPRGTMEDAQRLVDEANALTAAPLAVSAGNGEVLLEPGLLRSWLTVTSPTETDAAPSITFDESRVLGDLAVALATAERAPTDATISIVDARPLVTPGANGVRCCGPTAPSVVLDALRNRPPGAVALPVIETLPVTSTTDLEALGIVEQVSSWATPHRCCEARVDNIHKAADLLRGTIIKPGEVFSLNDALGERTEEGGWFSAPTIQEGVLVDDFGGGVSQIATTLFNAAYEAGLNFDFYQSHSFYITRYPFGREATVSWPAPDLKINNVSPYGILIWPTYTDTEIRITFYSTRWVESVVSTDPVTSIIELSCTRSEITRTITFLDGTQRSGVIRATYRAKIDAERGLECDQALTEDATITAAPNQPPPTLPNGVTTTRAPAVGPPTSPGETRAPTTTTTAATTTTAPTTTSAAPTTTTTTTTTTTVPPTDPPPTEPPPGG
jgi:vancomycin resistance protein YoaR